MTRYTMTQLRQNPAEVLKQARIEGQVMIQCRDGSTFEIRPLPGGKSPLDIKGIDLDLTRDEIVSIVRESRQPK